MTSQMTPNADAVMQNLLLRQEIEDFNSAYSAALDEGRLKDWPDFFTEDALYVVIARENFDRNLPVGLIYCEGRGMMADRAFAVEKTAMYAPRYLRHFIANTRVVKLAEDGSIQARANYIILQTLFDRPETTLHQVGVYLDTFKRENGALLLAERKCVYDNLLVANSLVYPI